MSFDDSWKITTIEKLITKIQQPKNDYVVKMIPTWLGKSEDYAQMMIEKYGHKQESYWYLKTLFVFNKIFPSLKHDFKAPQWTPDEGSRAEWSAEQMRATYENSQVFGVVCNEESFRLLEATFGVGETSK